MTFKIEISPFYNISEPNQWKWSKIRHYFMGHIQIWRYVIFYQEILNILMTFKFKISHFYDQSESKQWKWNKIRYFFMGHIHIWRHFSLVAKQENVSMTTLIIDIFQFIAKVSTNKWGEIKLNGTWANLTLFFLDKIYLKNK